MLPKITLREVTREDVDRIAGWLEDEDVSSRWFGHYACGDPVHRGYEPDHMLEAPQSEWDRVFGHDPRRFIFSIYSEADEHIGESQVMVDDAGGAELSLLIGRKDLWHRGYGTSAVLGLLDQLFNYYKLERAWVNVPQDNVPALGLFSKLGFAQLETQELCRRPDGSALSSGVLAMDARAFRASLSKQDQPSMPIVTVAGLPGSGSKIVAQAVARTTGGRFIDDEIESRMCRRLVRSIGELQSLEASYLSVWTRLLRAFLTPYERYGYGGLGYEAVNFWPTNVDHPGLQEYLTKEEYVEVLKRVVTEIALERNAVMHGHGAHLLIPDHVDALRVFVMASDTTRQQRFAAEQGFSAENAGKALKHADQRSLTVTKNLLGSDLLDMGLYDIVLNLDRLTAESAARKVVGALELLATTDLQETSLLVSWFGCVTITSLRVDQGAADRCLRGHVRPSESEGRRTLSELEPEQLPGPAKPASCKDGPVIRRRCSWIRKGST